MEYCPNNLERARHQVRNQRKPAIRTWSFKLQAATRVAELSVQREITLEISERMHNRVANRVPFKRQDSHDLIRR